LTSDLPFRTVELSDPIYEQDGLRLATVKSPALRRRADVSFWVPRAQEVDTLLILLHGVYGSHWVWSMKAGVHRTAQALLDAGEVAPMVIAMPSDGLARDGSAYLKHPNAEDVESWIMEEVPIIARLAAPALRADARIAIAGLSMGGYGALLLGSKYAERFCAISAHSAITDIGEMAHFVEEPMSEYRAALHEELSPIYWIKRNRDRLPPMRFDCGTADPLLSGNRILHASLEKENIPHIYQEFDGGHAWSYWRTHVASTLRFVNERSSKA
jgi:putative tributyrin esterase